MFEVRARVLARVVIGAVALAGLLVPVQSMAQSQSAPTVDDIIDALAPREPEERTRSFRTRGTSTVMPNEEPRPRPSAVGDATVTFDSNSATLDEQGKRVLRERYLNAIKVVESRARNWDQKQTLVVAGHTDRRGSDDYNDRLSNERAKAVVDYLQSELTTRGDKITRVVLESVGCGKRHLKVENDSNDGDVRENRRVVVRNLTKDPGAPPCSKNP